jgi:hypothetical protein
MLLEYTKSAIEEALSFCFEVGGGYKRVVLGDQRK